MVGKCAVPQLRNTPYCRRLASVRSPRHMMSHNASLAPALYDDYHRLRGDGIEGVADKASQAIAGSLTRLLPPHLFPAVVEGGPGNCWLLRQLRDQGYDVHGQEVSSFAIEQYCQGLDVRHGFLQHTTFQTGFADVVLSLDVMEHIPEVDLHAALREVRRICKSYFVFNVAPCAKLCYTPWFCADRTIHPTGLCDDFPRRWWERHLEHAGFAEAPEAVYAAFERAVLDYEPVTEASAHAAGGAACQGPAALKCVTPWNRRGHNLFIYRAAA